MNKKNIKVKHIIVVSTGNWEKYNINKSELNLSIEML